MNLRLRFLVPRLVPAVSLALLVAVSLVPRASAYTVRKDQSEVFNRSIPGGGMGTPASAETTVRHKVFFSDLESGATTGWSTMNWRAGMPMGWNLVSGIHACNANSWWCGKTGLAHGDGYGNNWVQSLTTNVPIDIAGASNTKINFKMRFQSEYGYDWGWILVKGANPGARWDTLASYSGDLGSTCSNMSVSVPDSFHNVTQPIAIQFLFGSDLTVSAEDSTALYTGWTLDDITVQSGSTTHFFDDMETGSSKWIAAAPNPGVFWHLESAPGISGTGNCFFLNTYVWVPFRGFGFGVVPDFADQMVMTPPMDLLGIFSAATPVPTLRLQFSEWINLPPDNSVYWSLWIQGSNDKVTWTPWKNAIFPLEFSGGTPQCVDSLWYEFDPYDTVRTGVTPNTRYIRLGIRIRDEKAIDGCQCGGPLYLGVDTEGLYLDNIGVYYVYTISGVEQVSGAALPTRTQIRRAFPNPFNPSTTVEFSVPKAGPVRVGIFDIRGSRVATLVNEAMSPGIYRVRWNGKDTSGVDAASGVYYAQIQSRGGSDSGRLVLIK